MVPLDSVSDFHIHRLLDNIFQGMVIYINSYELNQNTTELKLFPAPLKYVLFQVLLVGLDDLLALRNIDRVKVNFFIVSCKSITLVSLAGKQRGNKFNIVKLSVCIFVHPLENVIKIFFREGETPLSTFFHHHLQTKIFYGSHFGMCLDTCFISQTLILPSWLEFT